MTTSAALLPRLLRYKAEEGKTEGYWDATLEEANSILHERIRRKEEDNLCSGCARFDWLRTGLYTQNVETCDEASIVGPDPDESDISEPMSSHNLSEMRRQLRSLSGIKDRVPWNKFETFGREKEEACLLADHPRFKWDLLESSRLQCSLCTSLTALFEAEIRSLFDRDLLFVDLYAGPFLPHSENHRCVEVC